MNGLQCWWGAEGSGLAASHSAVKACAGSYPDVARALDSLNVAASIGLLREGSGSATMHSAARNEGSRAIRLGRLVSEKGSKHDQY